MYQLVDFVTKNPVLPHGLVFTGENSPWEVMLDMHIIAANINLEHFRKKSPGIAKYLPLMPVEMNSALRLFTEQATPLIKSRVLGERLGLDLYFKVESKNPTGSFKDRGSAVEVAVAKEFKAKGIILASTGNMAASCACYAAFAKIPCFVLVPENVSLAKLAQVIAYGGHLVRIKGDYNEAARLAKLLAEDIGFYLAGDYAYRVEGQKTAAFEIIDQLDFQVPDAVVVPIGCGTNLSAYAKGFREYHYLGLIDKVPQLIGVQAEGAAAVVDSFNKHKNTIQALHSTHTIASAIAVPDPIDGVKALEGIYATNGCAVAVSDQEILQAQHLLSTEEGLFVETASAATLAALIKSTDLKQRKVVCVLTGDGLKEAAAVLNNVAHLPFIEPSEKEFLKLYQDDFFRR
jgi:threonine synthase